VKINVKRLLNGEITSQHFEYDFPIGLEESEFSFPEEVHVSGEIKNAGGYIPLTATCSLTVEGVCARCLKPVSEKMEIEFRRTVAASLEAEDEDDEYLLVTEDCIEIGEPISDETVLSLPLRLLCSEDCKGLCQKCGADLNHGKCNCPEHEPDPRWAALKKLFDNK
jgi:uncharacterized protein